MVKRTYIIPEFLVVNLVSRDALLQSVSGKASLSGTSYGGNSSDAGDISADVKESTDINVWDDEW